MGSIIEIKNQIYKIIKMLFVNLCLLQDYLFLKNNRLNNPELKTKKKKILLDPIQFLYKMLLVKLINKIIIRYLNNNKLIIIIMMI